MSGLAATGAFVMGLFGGLHCVTMCGPIAAVLCTRNEGADRRLAVATNLGRITSYSILGAMLGALGGEIARRVHLADAQLVTRLVAAAALVFVGLRLAGIVRARGSSRRAGTGRVGGAGWLLRQAPGLVPAFLRGAAWGLLPCGLVYGALALALASGTARDGAVVMLAFGAGTLPAIGAAIVLMGRMSPWLKHATFRAVAGLLLIVSGSVHAAMVVMSSGAIPIPEETKPCCASRGVNAGEPPRD
jgi:uncharacterized protein